MVVLIIVRVHLHNKGKDHELFIEDKISLNAKTQIEVSRENIVRKEKKIIKQ